MQKNNNEQWNSKETVNLGGEWSSSSYNKANNLDMQEGQAETAKSPIQLGYTVTKSLWAESVCDVMSVWLAPRLHGGFAHWSSQIIACIIAEI